ncbi:MAG: ABC transporter substrate-binding protein [Clostridia bacterium]
MKKMFCTVMALMMMAAVFAGCAPAAPATDTATGEIIVGMEGPYTGDTAVYGLAVRNGAQLYFDQLNAAGGINGKQVKVVAYDNKGDDAEAVTAFNRMVDQDGITCLVGDVLTGNTIAVVGEAYPINMPMITASATAAAVTVNESDGTVYTNVFRTCFIDPFQGEKMATYATEKLSAKTAGVIVQTGDAYSAGLAEAFVAKCAELGIEVVAQEGYAKGDVDFKAQLTNIMSKNPDVVFCPNYYQDDGMIITQARSIGLTATFLGGDGWAGIAQYASAADLEGSYYCSAYAPNSTDAVKSFEAAYKTAYGEDVPNMFAALAYDAASLMCAALTKAEASGEKQGSDAYKQAVIDAIKSEGASVDGVTSANGYTFDENNNPIKDAVIMTLTDGVETFKEMF